MLTDFFKLTPNSRKVRLNNTKNGVLFSNPSGIKKAIFYFGNGLFVISVIFIIFLYYPIFKAYFNYYQIPKYSVQNNTKIEPTPTLTIPKTVTKERYSINIPKILANANVVDNVSPFDSKEYLRVLDNNVVAQAKGTASPGSGLGKSIYIFAHSSGGGLNMIRKNPVFYLLGELKNDDVVSIEKNGVNYNYRVYSKLIINANQTEYLKYSDPDKEVLILQTCWPVGTDWKRLLIFAKLVSN